MTEGSSSSRQRVTALMWLAIATSALFFLLVRHFILTLVMAAVLAGVANPIYERLRSRFGGRKAAASAVTVLSTLVVIIVPGLVFLGGLLSSALRAGAAARQWIGESVAQHALRDWLAQIPWVQHLVPYEDLILRKAGELAGATARFAASELTAVTVGIGEFLFLLFVALYAMYYFLIGGRSLIERVLAATPLLPEDRRRLTGTFLTAAEAALKGTVVVGVVQGGLAGLAFWVAGIPAATFWAVVMAVFSVIPGIGAALIWLPAVALLALKGNVAAASGVALWCTLVVSTVDNLLRPRLVGQTAHLPNLLVLLSTLGGLLVFGVAGLVVGPVIGALFATAWQMWRQALSEAPIADMGPSSNSAAPGAELSSAGHRRGKGDDPWKPTRSR